MHDNDYIYRPDDHVFDRHRGETPVLSHDFASVGAQQEQTPFAKGSVNADTPANKINDYGNLQYDAYEHPSAKPRPLRRVSGYSSSRSSSGRSLRDAYHEAGGLGIELSENSSKIYAHDNGTTLGVDGDNNFERRRDMVNMRSPDFYLKQSGFNERRKSREHKHHSHPVESRKYVDSALPAHHEKEMQHLIDILDAKIERVAAVQSRNEGLLTSIHMSVAHVMAEQRKTREQLDAMLVEDRKTREAMDAIVANHQVIRDTLEIIVADTHDIRLLHDVAADTRLLQGVAADTRLLQGVASDSRLTVAETRKMHQSIADMAEHGVDNEKLDLLVDKVVERLHPTIVWAMEKGDQNTERLLTRLDQGKERKQRHDHFAGQTSNNGYTSPTNGVHYAPNNHLHFSPSANGPFAAHNNEFFNPPGGAQFRGRNGAYKYSEDPSQR